MHIAKTLLNAFLCKVLPTDSGNQIPCRAARQRPTAAATATTTPACRRLGNIRPIGATKPRAAHAGICISWRVLGTTVQFFNVRTSRRHVGIGDRVSEVRGIRVLRTGQQHRSTRIAVRVHHAAICITLNLTARCTPARSHRKRIERHKTLRGTLVVLARQLIGLVTPRAIERVEPAGDVHVILAHRATSRQLLRFRRKCIGQATERCGLSRLLHERGLEPTT